MLRSLWISKTGMEAQQLQLDNISHNLANVATNGYKKSHAQFEDLIYQNLRQSGSATSDQTQLPSGLQVEGSGEQGGRQRGRRTEQQGGRQPPVHVAERSAAARTAPAREPERGRHQGRAEGPDDEQDVRRRLVDAAARGQRQRPHQPAEAERGAEEQA